MVRSMFNLTTLPLSFWDYALESAVRILNMVPTKKVDKTPYEIWHGKVPNLCLFKVGCEAYAENVTLADKLNRDLSSVSLYGDFLGKRSHISRIQWGEIGSGQIDHIDTLPSENNYRDLGELLIIRAAMIDPDKMREKALHEKGTYASAGRILIMYCCKVHKARSGIAKLVSRNSRYMNLMLQVSVMVLCSVIKDMIRRLRRLCLCFQWRSSRPGEQKQTYHCDACAQSGVHAASGSCIGSSLDRGYNREFVWGRAENGSWSCGLHLRKPLIWYSGQSAAIIFANDPGVMKAPDIFCGISLCSRQVESGENQVKIKVHTDKN
ncbi:retrotransposon protein, putative, ty1-copia subclass [Tanacetum coccineum]